MRRRLKLVVFIQILCISIVEQSRLANNYMKEACSLHAALHGNRTCDIQIEPTKLHIPIVPCNFVPIQPQYYTGKI